MRCWISVLLLVGCSGDATDSAAAVDAAEAACQGTPHLTWESHGEAIITEACQPCHASTSELRNGAPENVTFDSYEETLAWKDRILATSTTADPTMPPNINLSEIDRDNLWIWLTCWE